MNINEYNKLCESNVSDIKEISRIKRLNLLNEAIIKEKLLEDDIYILWLNHYTSSNNWITSKLIYNKNMNLSINENFINSLGLFYNTIDSYAKNNFIKPTSNKKISYYLLRVGDIGYKIGKVYIQENEQYFCERESIDKNKYYINYEDIKNNNIIIGDKLELLSIMINNLVKENIPIEEIESSINKTIKKIKKS